MKKKVYTFPRVKPAHGNAAVDELPYRIIPGEGAHYRESIFLKRAIVGERIRLAIGLPLRLIARYQKEAARTNPMDSVYEEEPRLLKRFKLEEKG